MKKRILWIVLDLTAAVFIILAVWIVNYKIPQKGIKAVSFPQMESGRDSEWDIALPGTGMQPDSLIATHVVMDVQDWHEKFADKFTDTVVATDTSYTSPDLSVWLSYGHYDTGILDSSENGKHIKYGTKVSYVVADIYMGDITCFRTAFAQNMYGVGYSEKLSDMSSKIKAVLAVNTLELLNYGLDGFSKVKISEDKAYFEEMLKKENPIFEKSFTSEFDADNSYVIIPTELKVSDLNIKFDYGETETVTAQYFYDNHLVGRIDLTVKGIQSESDIMENTVQEPLSEEKDSEGSYFNRKHIIFTIIIGVLVMGIFIKVSLETYRSKSRRNRIRKE